MRGDAAGAQWTLAQTFEYEGDVVRYDVQGMGPPLVLVHGTPWSSFNWRHVIAALRDRFTVYYYDLLGYGQSEKREGQRVSLDVQGDLLYRLLQHWGLEQTFAAGHDFGGTTVLRAHLLHGADFSRFALIDPVALAPWGSSFFNLVGEHADVFARVPDYIHEAIVTAYVKGATYRPMDRETLQGILRPWLGESGKAAFYRQIAQADQRFTDEIEDRYADIARPVLIVWGEEDGWIPAERGEELHKRIPGSTLRLAPEAGHLVQEDAPALLVSHLSRFFYGHDA